MAPLVVDGLEPVQVHVEHGGVAAILETSPEERARLGALEAMDARLTVIRNALRNGERIDRLE